MARYLGGRRVLAYRTKARQIHRKLGQAGTQKEGMDRCTENTTEETPDHRSALCQTCRRINKETPAVLAPPCQRPLLRQGVSGAPPGIRNIPNRAQFRQSPNREAALLSPGIFL
ncbi:hypothetical protein NDU88_002414 [Pleurodeles waltl]|uniref:Uncharacterized protein n=1 Tax=Pleurodeles waltl TaxID=8319 RepID=A0AAV7TN66_PLEWA|nr:hypothetical protein NDU88_002414 [Pleurodeles waltl]